MAEIDGKLFLFGEFEFDAGELILRHSGEEIPLPPKVSEVLGILLEKEGRIVGKDELMDRVWPDSFVEDGSLSQCIYGLRRELGKRMSGARIVETIPRRGFRIALPISIATAAGEPDASAQIPAARRQRQRSIWSNPILWLGIAAFAVAAIAVPLFMVFGRGRVDHSPVESVTFQKLTFSGDVTFPVIAPDGKSFAFVRENSIFVQDVENGSAYKLNVVGQKVFAYLQFTPDGAGICFRNEERVDSPGTAFVVSRFGGEASKLADEVWSGIGFSPDGKRAAFVRFLADPAEWTLVLKDLSDGKEMRVSTSRLPNTIFRSGFPAWSPDGSRLAFVEQDRDDGQRSVLRIIPVNGGDGTTVETKGLVQIEQAIWSAAGDEILLAGRENNRFFQLWKVSLANPVPVRITNDLNIYRFLSHSSDGRNLIARLQTMNSNIWISDAESGPSLKQITFGNLNRDGNAGLNWTPDGRLLYASRIAGNIDIWIVDPVDGSRRQLTENAGSNNVRPAPSADGKFVFFESNRGGTRHIWRINIDGSNAVQMTRSNGESEYSPVPSDDGKWLYFIQKNPTSLSICRLDLDADRKETLGHLRNVAPDAILSLSPDAKMIAYHTLDRANEGTETEPNLSVVVAKVDDSNSVPLMFRIRSSNSKIWWTVNSKAFDFVENAAGRVAKIWRQTLDRAEPELLMELPKTNIYQLARSPRGDRFAIAQGDFETDAILLRNF